MKNIDSRRVKSVVRVSALIAKHNLDRPPYGAVVKRIQAAAEHLQALDIEQQDAHSAWVGQSNILDGLHLELRKGHLIKIARVGKRLLEGKPGAVEAFKVPGKHSAARALIEFSKGFVAFIKEDAPLFVEEQQPRNFLVRLRAATRHLEACQRTIDASIKRQMRATDAILKAVPAARGDVDILDGLLAERIRDDGHFAVDWATAKIVGKRKGQPRHGKWEWRTRTEAWKPSRKRGRKKRGDEP